MPPRLNGRWQGLPGTMPVPRPFTEGHGGATDRHRHRRHVHRRRGVRRVHRHARDHEDPVDAERPGRRIPRRHREDPRTTRRVWRRRPLGQSRDDRRDEPVARGQGRAARVHHDRGVRVRPRDRPAVGARRVRQFVLLGEAGPDRAGAPGEDSGWAPRSSRRRTASVRRAACGRSRALVPGEGHRHARRVLPALVRESGARTADARRPRARTPGRGRVHLQRRVA